MNSLFPVLLHVSQGRDGSITAQLLSLVLFLPHHCSQNISLDSLRKAHAAMSAFDNFKGFAKIIAPFNEFLSLIHRSQYLNKVTLTNWP